MNIVNAIINLVNNPITRLVDYYQGKNRVNNEGDTLEEYIKDLFAGSFDLSEKNRLDSISKAFSYLGNNSNPPDAMLRNGDAIEVKKTETEAAPLALNSSYPKQKIRVSDPMITAACKSSEDWNEKDIIYVVGSVKNKILKNLCMVYGLDYCASEECYSKIKTTVKNGIESIPGIEFTESRELGHINKVDPLGITYMRVRGMWGIENPWKVFNYVYTRNPQKRFNFMSIINFNKWKTLEGTRELLRLSQNKAELSILDVKIKNPDNPARLVDAKLVSFSV